MGTKEQDSSKVFETLNTDLHQYFDLASESLEAPQPIFDEIVANEDRYNQGALINQGGMKRILQTTDSLTGRPVAMAVPHDPENPRKVERFLREARLTAALEHPNIIPVYDIGVSDAGDPFFTMKLIGGRNLSQILKALSKGEEVEDFSQQTLMDIFIKVCDAIAYAHSKGILHLDLKPENIQVDQFGEVLVCDWGLGKVLNSVEDMQENELDPCLYNDITLDGVIKGTPGFMAPEQIDFNLGEKDKRTDIYALGGILYSLLTLNPPISHKDIQKTLDDTVAGAIIEPSQKAPKRTVSHSLEAVSMKALNLQQNNRYQSVIEMRNEIYKWIGGFATSAENAGFSKSSWLLFKRHKAVGFLLVIILCFATFSFIKIKENEKHAIENEKKAIENEIKAVEALALYEEEKKQTEIISREAAPRLVYLAKQHLNSFEYQKALKLVDKSIDYNSNNIFSYATKGQIHFFKQEFNQALAAFAKSKKYQEQSHFKKMIALAQKYSKKKSSDDDLLDSTDFISLLKSYQNKPQLSKLFRYEAKHYSSLEDHMEVCFFMLKHYNPQVKNWNFQFTYNDERASLDLSGNKNMSNIACLRNLPIDHLDISGTSAWQDWVLLEMPLTELNIKKTSFKNLNDILKMKSLKTLRISSNKFLRAKPPQKSELVILREPTN